MGDWQLLSNHGRVLVSVARDPAARLRDIADAVGITERTAHRLVSELIEAGFLVRSREGRRNRYEIQLEAPIRDSLLADRGVGELLVTLVDYNSRREQEATRPGKTRGQLSLGTLAS